MLMLVNAYGRKLQYRVGINDSSLYPVSIEDCQKLFVIIGNTLEDRCGKISVTTTY